MAPPLAPRGDLIPVTLELGGKSPNIFFADVMAEDDAFLDKALTLLRRSGFKPAEGFERFAEHRQAAIDAVRAR